ncbi:MATH domain containing protein [Trichuris trichiura]|uniref:MATH domain containing protein n=1 Tax=Trichuris trichiura TaxID=36087 RepID=A0A077ZM31_TRITR|nr:MATH domain containing protein [Trichuris trichiura]
MPKCPYCQVLLPHEVPCQSYQSAAQQSREHRSGSGENSDGTPNGMERNTAILNPPNALRVVNDTAFIRRPVVPRFVSVGMNAKFFFISRKIMVMPRQHTVAKKGNQKCLGFFLQCCPDSYSDSWSCQASAELRMISQRPSVSDFVRKTTHEYTAKENDWGYSCFMTWADVLDENQGYLKDGGITLAVLVKAEAPKGILSHEAFVKKIEDYIRLADLQSSRGLIDKAIEVNMSAAKFCKDKDLEVRGRLETQRVNLIKLKLKQSIERIENGTSLFVVESSVALP